MKHEHKKIGKIIDEMSTFFLVHGAKQIEMTLKDTPLQTEITFHVDQLDEKDRMVKMLEQLISFPRQEDMDECYWSLAGESDHDTELSLIGNMVDEVKFYHKQKDFTILLIRKKDS